jgi:cyclohexanecarboxylate-CoA ligase
MREVTENFVVAARDRDWCAAVDDDGQWSARQLLDEAVALAAGLAAAPTRPTVLVQAENSRRLVVAGLAVGLVDGTLALASEHAGREDIAAILAATRPNAILGQPQRLDRWQLGASTHREVDFGWQLRPVDGPDDPERWGDGVLIGMTSGSTGRSKGVVHRESALRYAAEQEIAASGLVEGDPIGVIVPVSAAPAYAFGIYTALLLRSAALLSARWSPPAALDRLAAHRARWLMCVPTQVVQLSAAAESRPGVLAAMRSITVGGGPMEYRSLLEAEERLGVTLLRVFGMSECLGHTTPRLNDPPQIRLQRDGRPFPGTDVRIVGDDGADVGFDVVGRAQVKGPSLFLGYAEDGRLHPPTLTPDGYLETGDLMLRHRDGMLQVSGRIKDVIIRGGRNISIAEVERALLADDRIESVCVVPVPDPILGERVAALAVTDEPDLALASVLKTLERNGVAKVNWPEHLIPVDALPMTHVGKVSRRLARQIAIETLEGTG